MARGAASNDAARRASLCAAHPMCVLYRLAKTAKLSHTEDLSSRPVRLPGQAARRAITASSAGPIVLFGCRGAEQLGCVLSLP